MDDKNSLCFRIGYSILAHCALRASSRCTYLFLMNVRTCVHMLYRGMLDLQTLIYFPFEQTIAHFIYNSNIKSLRFKINYSSSKLRKTQNEHRLSKSDRSVVVNLKPISIFYCLFHLLFALEAVGVN